MDLLLLITVIGDRYLVLYDKCHHDNASRVFVLDLLSRACPILYRTSSGEFIASGCATTQSCCTARVFLLVMSCSTDDSGRLLIADIDTGNVQWTEKASIASNEIRSDHYSVIALSNQLVLFCPSYRSKIEKRDEMYIVQLSEHSTKVSLERIVRFRMEADAVCAAVRTLFERQELLVVHLTDSGSNGFK
jgi:hypothetical protein